MTRRKEQNSGGDIISSLKSRLADAREDEVFSRQEIAALLSAYAALEKRLNRIIKISDKYQFESREIKEKFEREAKIDYLTGLVNRREMYRLLQAEIARVSRHGGRLAVIMFDYDNFKGINDSHGHEAGDLILQHGSSLLHQILRQEDTCGRWGGEEFIIIQPGTSKSGLLRSAERLRLVFEQHPFQYKESKITATISLGVAVHQPGESAQELLFRADESLYDAKKQGRNKVGPCSDAACGKNTAGQA